MGLGAYLKKITSPIGFISFINSANTEHLFFVKPGQNTRGCSSHTKWCKLIGPSLHCWCWVNMVWLPSVKCQGTDQSLWRMTPIFPKYMWFSGNLYPLTLKCLWVILRRWCLPLCYPLFPPPSETELGWFWGPDLTLPPMDGWSVVSLSPRNSAKKHTDHLSQTCSNEHYYYY